MTGNKLQYLTSLMIYVGTMLISVLSFFTTYYGMTIFLPQALALLGSLGIQMAMLGIAWNLMNLKQNRITYAAVFSIAAVFSVFFSYANFNIALKEETRSQDARNRYAAAALPVMNQYTDAAKLAAHRGEYQKQRIADLLQMETKKGWATVVDEGSEDAVVQGIIEGARRTVASWKKNTGTDYQQGSGEGIISNFVTTQSKRLDDNLRNIYSYIALADSLTRSLDNNQSVRSQYETANYSYLRFPTAEIAMIVANENPAISAPPLTSGYLEKAANGQQALMLVIHDLLSMDHLTFFSLVFAMVIDLIVLCLAITGSQIINQTDLAFNRIEKEIARRVKRLPVDDSRIVNQTLSLNLEQLREAGRYGETIGKIQIEFEEAKKRLRLMRGPESTPTRSVVNRVRHIDYAGALRGISRWTRLDKLIDKVRPLDKVGS